MPIQPWISKNETKYPQDPEASEAVTAASFILYALSGRKYPGLHTVTDLYEVPIDGPIRRLLLSPTSSSWITEAPGRRARLRIDRPQIRLRLSPVLSINEIRIGAERQLVPSDQYELISAAIVRPTFGATWAPFGAVEITYTGGASPPEAGKRAARVLANELMKARLDTENCQLPDRVTSISRQGLSMTVLDPQDFLDHGRIGIYEVDLFLKAVNPAGALAKPKIFSPDLPRVRRIQRPSGPSQLGVEDLAVVPGLPLEKDFTWIVGGSFPPLSADWTPNAGIYDQEGGNLLFDLSSYVELEPDNVPGAIKLFVPGTDTLPIDSGTYWALTLSRISQPSTVVKVVSGRVVVE